jgi:excisionase family DNA binding protein
MSPVPLAYPVPDAAVALGVSARHVWNCIARGEVRSIRLGRRVLIPATEIDRLLGGSTPEPK